MIYNYLAACATVQLRYLLVHLIGLGTASIQFHASIAPEFIYFAF
ncbi:MAG TPA: hypothetical protein O0X07_07285 [Methanocorpusculum sp.]|nr:hypothetical protein [Methanocorpusculum sp.]